MSHSYGKGTVYYLGSAFSGDTAEKLLLKMPAVFEDAWWLNLPPEVELTIRGAGEEKFYFLLNYKPGSHAGLSDRECCGSSDWKRTFR